MRNENSMVSRSRIKPLPFLCYLRFSYFKIGTHSQIAGSLASVRPPRVSRMTTAWRRALRFTFYYRSACWLQSAITKGTWNKNWRGVFQTRWCRRLHDNNLIVFVSTRMFLFCWIQFISYISCYVRFSVRDF